ncbi:MAG: serine/threonine-protein kinase [Planctomycetota bacterium]
MPHHFDEELIGQRIGPDSRYLIKRRLGEGGTGVVFLAVEEEKGREIAIKFLVDGVDDAEVIRRFKLEGQRFSKIKHPNIVRVYGMGRAKNMLYIASEYVSGLNLYDYMAERGRPDIDRGLAIIADVASGLASAHELGVIHRDLKPENVMINNEAQVKILDFGIAKDLNASVALTVKGAYIGTPAYSAPEQVKGLAIDYRADIFSLGVMLYELVTGELPFKGKRTTEILLNTIKVDPINPSRINKDVSAPVAKLIARMIAKKPKSRISSCADVSDEIAGVRRHLAGHYSGEERSGVVGFLKDIFGN